jgi:hypothetical protein
MKIQKWFQFLPLILLTACSSTTAIEQTPVPNSLPDLVITSVGIAMQGASANPAECVPAYGPYEIRAVIENRGFAPATNISILEQSTGHETLIAELPAGLRLEISMPATSPNGMYALQADPNNLIPEIDESNNSASFLAPTPTPPVLCSEPATPAASDIQDHVLSLSVLNNSMYRSPDWGEYQLTDAVYYRPPAAPGESPDSNITRLMEPILYGDINADGVEDALVFLSTQSGGTGRFVELAAVIDQNGSAYNISTLYLGDRVIVESGSVENGTVILNMLIQGPNDGLCCPSQHVTWKFILSNGQLLKQE